MTSIRSGSRLGESLRTARRTAGLTQAALAQAVGCSERTVRQAEAGQGQADLLLRMASALGHGVCGRALPAGDGLGSQLLALRLRTGRSRRSLAALSGVAESAIARLESGRLGHLDVLERVGDALGAGLTLQPDGVTPFFSGSAASSAWDAWATPASLLERLYPVVGGGFDLDPCSPGRGRSRVRARRHFDEADDGLAQPWRGRVYMNPPYGRGLGRWTAKAAAEVAAGRATLVIGLVPARTDTGWWHRSVADRADAWMLRGRLSFGDGLCPAPFPSSLLAWGACDLIREGMSAAFPDAWMVRGSGRMVDDLQVTRST